MQRSGCWRGGACVLIACLLVTFQEISAARSLEQLHSRFTDGPAELPRSTVKSSLADTPAPGHAHLAKTSDELTRALDEAKCGDTIRLQQSATFFGKFIFPAKPCDDSHWIIVRTTAADADLPAEGKRLTPCFAGVSSLPGRPDFHCSSTQNVLVRIEFESNSGSGPVVFASGANHYRFIGLEITRSSEGTSIGNLVSVEEGGRADHLVFDRIWFHGLAQAETRRGIQLGGSTYVAIVDSFFTDFHCVAIAGNCTDSQAIGGGNSDNPMGPYKIDNNFLEAAGENIMFGGGKSTTVPSDIEIRHNHLFKPMIWMRGTPGFVGGTDGHPFIVKNHFELKNAERVLFEDNLLENSWGGFTQAGFSIGLSPKNQSGRLCPLCRVNDVTIRYCRIAHVAGAFTIANALAAGAASSGGGRYSIHDVVVEDIDGDKFGGFGILILLMSIAPKLADLRIDHITGLAPTALLSVLIKNDKISNFTFSNSVVAAGRRQIASAGGGRENCAVFPGQRTPEAILKNCVDGLSFTNNVIIGGSGTWPAGNILVDDTAAVGFMKVSVPHPNYRLCQGKDDSCRAASAYIRGGTNKKDLGADVNAIDAAIAGVD